MPQPNPTEYEQVAKSMWLINPNTGLPAGSEDAPVYVTLASGLLVTIPAVVTIQRHFSPIEVTIPAGGSLSNAFDLSKWAGGQLDMSPAIEANTYIGFHICPTENGTFKPLYNSDGIVQCTDSGTPVVAGRVYEIPAGLFGAGYVKLWSQNGSGANLNQAAARLFTVMRKG